MSNSTQSGGPAGTAPATDGAAAPTGYELLDEVGRGGMGVVYRARDLALNREVAVKLLRDTFAPDSATAARFVDEAQITARLQHPGIPPVYHVGTWTDGRPFLAMKLIQGQTLDVILTSREPPHSPDTLAVFEAVAQAVGYAHARAVIHRDLKPANVMVGAFGEVQVMDWGLAKFLGERPRASGPSASADRGAAESPAPDSGLTLAGSVLGTPAFMPPEQAAGAVERMDARSDVFGLGAILAVALTGEPPFVAWSAEATRRMAEAGRLDECFARLDRCGADPDVVALCKRCLAVAPADRPATANDVAAAVAALRRAADDRARQAERDKLAVEVRAAEQAKRRRLLQLTTAAIAWVLAAGVVGSLWQAGVARREARDAHAARLNAEAAERETEKKRGEAEAARRAEADQRRKAEAKEAEANAVVQFFQLKVFAAARPKGLAGGLGRDVSLRAAITAGLPALATGFADQPLVEARLRHTMGVTFWHLGDHAAAVAQQERARALYTRWNGPDHPDTLKSANNLATSYSELGRHADALKLREETLAAQKRVHPPDHPDVLLGMNNLAISYGEVGRHADALALNQATLAACKRVLPPDHPLTLMSVNNLATSHAALGRPADAAELHAEALAAARRLNPPDHPDTLSRVYNLGACYSDLGRHADALALRAEALAGRRRVLPPNHPDTLMSLWGVAESLIKLNRGAEAIPLIDECVARAAGQTVHPDLLPEVIELRVRHFERAADAAGCRATAGMWEAQNFTDARSLYDAACYRAIAARLYARANHPAEATADADRAIALLTKAVAAGWRDRERVEEDDDLAFLRVRPDFQKLVASLPYAAPPPRPKR